MVYYKNVEDGYILNVESSNSDNEITEEEYNQILEIIRNKPQEQSGYDYRLRENLTWELYSLSNPEEDLEELLRF